MITAAKVISNEIDKLKRRLIKVTRFGKSDTQTSLEAMPFGVDSVPVEDLVAIHVKTAEKGKTMIIGYLNKNSIAGIGEHRTYSTDADGVEKTYIWLKNDGIIEVGGSSDFMVRYSALETAFNELKGRFNTFANTYVPGGPTVVGLPPSVLPSSADISAAKINEVKTL